MPAYYNEIEPFAAAWLRELIARNIIAPGEVDERSIEDVSATDLAGYTQCHFFAGIGVWSYALRRAGWSDDSPVWTGSCPCQPFSASGKGEGFDDPRHLWPTWHRLIRECRPNVVFGEQVADKSGRAWLDIVSADLEDDQYAVGAAAFPAASVGAPHPRHRIYFVGDAELARLEGHARDGAGSTRSERQVSESHRPTSTAGIRPRVRLADANSEGRERRAQLHELRPAERERRDDPDGRGGSAWSAAQPVEGADGAWRLLEPGIEPVADGTPDRVGRIRCYGNAIVAPQAAAFIEAYLDCRRPMTNREHAVEISAL